MASIDDDIKQFKYISLEKQSPGLKRSITTAAFLAFILPVFINLLTNKYPYIEFPVKIEKVVTNGANKIVEIVITNEGSKTIDNMIVNFKYYDNFLLDYSSSFPENVYADISLIGRQPPLADGPNDHTPFRGSFIINNLPGRAPARISLHLTTSTKDFEIDHIVKDRAAIVTGEYPILRANVFYLSLAAAALCFLLWRIFLYGVSLWDSRGLERCLNIIVADLANSPQNPEWYQRPLTHLYDYWKKLRVCSPDAPKELEIFLEYLRRKNMIFEMLDKGVIWIAPFDVLGSPTFTKLFANRKRALLVKLDPDLKVLKCQVEFCGKLLRQG